MTRRRLELLGYLIAGVVVSLVVAWGCALWSPLLNSRPLEANEAATLLADRLGGGEFTATPGGIKNWGPGWAFVFAVDAKPPAPPPRVVRSSPQPPKPRDASFSRVPGDPGDRLIQIVAAGWPLACLDGDQRTIDGAMSRRSLVPPPPLIESFGVKPLRLMPLRPLWLGLAADTAFYAALLLLVIPGPRFARQWVRRRRGRCESCGYDLRGDYSDGCSECGWQRSSKA